ncbi:MAG: glycoside hydrolase family 32 protein [Armatimonadaceae bacterium]
MNDPIPFFDGKMYHLFFQHNPAGAYWDDMHWGHAVSADLVQWEQKPIALTPTPEGSDRGGVWTGCVTQDGSGQVVALYTGIAAHKPFQQVHCLARAQDSELKDWEKWDGNPITAPQPQGFGTCFRDPQVFEIGDGHRYMLIGGEQIERRGGTAFLYRAQNDELTEWQFLHPLFLGDPATGHDFECPDFFPLQYELAAGKGIPLRLGGQGQAWVLLTSREKTWWHAGQLSEDLRFVRTAFGPCDEGQFYAGKTLLDGQGRRLLFGWIRESRPRDAQVADGWSGALSLPRVVTLGRDGLPRFAPAPELHTLRQRQIIAAHLQTAAYSAPPLPDTSEVYIRFRPAEDAAPELKVTVEYGQEKREYMVPKGDESPEGTVRFFFDRSVIEIFFNDTRCHTERIYAEDGADAEIRLSVAAEAGNKPAEIEFVAWELG